MGALAVSAVALTAAGAAMASELSWSAPQKIDATESPYADPSLNVSCATALFCVAVDKNTNAMIYNGSSWTTPTSVKGSFLFPLYSVSCPTTSFCMAGGSSNALIYNGSSWTTPTHVEGFNQASCPSASFCMGVLGTEAITYNGSSWSAPTAIDSATEGIDSVSCSSSSFCAAVDAEGNAITYNGSSWAAPVDIDGTEGIGGLSCVSSSFCVAVDWSGNVLVYNGSSWSTTTNIGSAAAVSCPSASFCAAVDINGNAQTYNGSTWTTSTGVIGPSEGDGLSCVSSSFCVATEMHGNALIYAEHESSGDGGSGSGGSGSGGSGGGGGPGGEGGGGTVALHVGGTLPVSHNAVRVGVQCTGSGKCTGKVTLTTTVHRAHSSHLARSLRSHSKSRIIGRHAFSIAAGKSASIAVHLNAAGKKALRAAHGKLKARLTVSGVASGKSVDESKTVTLKAGRK